MEHFTIHSARLENHMVLGDIVRRIKNLSPAHRQELLSAIYQNNGPCPMDSLECIFEKAKRLLRNEQKELAKKLIEGF